MVRVPFNNSTLNYSIVTANPVPRSHAVHYWSIAFSIAANTTHLTVLITSITHKSMSHFPPFGKPAVKLPPVSFSHFRVCCLLMLSRVNCVCVWLCVCVHVCSCHAAFMDPLPGDKVICCGVVISLSSYPPLIELCGCRAPALDWDLLKEWENWYWHTDILLCGTYV